MVLYLFYSNDFIYVVGEKNMIPKIIHYCWYGHNKKSKLIRKCINSWKEYFPDYKIIEWNESNSDISINSYVKKAYEEKKWAFVSDYMRMYVLYKYGGIYFDTDVEVLKKFPQSVLNNSCFTGIESFSKLINPGLVFGCEPHNLVVKQVLDSYNFDQFENVSIDRIKTINMRITDLLKKSGYLLEDKEQTVSGIHIYPSEVFCAYDGVNRVTKITVNSLSTHHYAASWFPWHRKLRLRVGTFLRHVRMNLKKLIYKVR